MRERTEWDTGHAPGATLVPLGQLSRRVGKVPRDREIITVCCSGNCSGVAAVMLRRAGFPRVQSMAASMVAWSRAGLTVGR